ncbi:cytochrome b [Microbulbifer thermotolerans]|uniref:cytochrome b n=1 Tax=Microbulbifer thermotolerans TaxID=252514 RepID=UPI0026711002|nr:cytochrome b [Microbulbifer thermotolerans]WKT59855.1 cytochrome b [Microbulbifer thermotolerans]
MAARNSDTQYSWVSITLHWLMAPAAIGLFALGWWMRQLSYYDPWYRQGPELHKSIGILLACALLFRLFWKLFNPTPAPLANTAPWQTLAARLIHGALYLLLFAIVLSGYLISTADGRAIEVFAWFSVPATIQGIPNQEDIAGQIHKILAWTLMALVSLHALAALKHHFIDRDGTLRRMLGLAPQPGKPLPQTQVSLTNNTEGDLQ